jgi:starch phosphorylase
VAFVDDYDLHVAHFLVQGCDVWLEHPRSRSKPAARAA